MGYFGIFRWRDTECILVEMSCGISYVGLGDSGFQLVGWVKWVD